MRSGEGSPSWTAEVEVSAANARKGWLVSEKSKNPIAKRRGSFMFLSFAQEITPVPWTRGVVSIAKAVEGGKPETAKIGGDFGLLRRKDC